jgi:hypothetical protein
VKMKVGLEAWLYVVEAIKSISWSRKRNCKILLERVIVGSIVLSCPAQEGCRFGGGAAGLKIILSLAYLTKFPR